MISAAETIIVGEKGEIQENALVEIIMNTILADTIAEMVAAAIITATAADIMVAVVEITEKIIIEMIEKWGAMVVVIDIEIITDFGDFCNYLKSFTHISL